jgi:hypothetical protein
LKTLHIASVGRSPDWRTLRPAPEGAQCKPQQCSWDHPIALHEFVDLSGALRTAALRLDRAAVADLWDIHVGEHGVMPAWCIFLRTYEDALIRVRDMLKKAQSRAGAGVMRRLADVKALIDKTGKQRMKLNAQKALNASPGEVATPFEMLCADHNPAYTPIYTSIDDVEECTWTEKVQELILGDDAFDTYMSTSLSDDPIEDLKWERFISSRACHMFHEAHKSRAWVKVYSIPCPRRRN